jgi:uncharacterized membrane protein
MKPARVSTIVWGVALLIIAASSFAFVAWDVELVEGFTLVHVVVGFGALLVVAALVGSVAQLTRRSSPIAETTEKDQPVD